MTTGWWLRISGIRWVRISGTHSAECAFWVNLLSESRKHSAVKLLRQIPAIGPIRAALLVALLQTPHRFRTKRQLWAYSGFAVETHDNGEYRYLRGKQQRTRERITVRGLNPIHNHDLKNLFKGAALSASTRPGPLLRFLWLW
jgi:hypothetical protein